MELKEVLAIGGVALSVGGSCMGGFVIIGKWLLRSTEKHNEIIPVMADNLKTQNDAIKELFKSRNDHEVRITVTEEICDRNHAAAVAKKRAEHCRP